MDLSPKAIRFIIESLQHYRDQLDRRLEDNGLSDDELADLGNDREYISALVQGFQLHNELGLEKPRQLIS
jgi:uncharacterized protein YjiS (DUF1127 family)